MNILTLKELKLIFKCIILKLLEQVYKWAIPYWTYKQIWNSEIHLLYEKSQ